MEIDASFLQQHTLGRESVTQSLSISMSLAPPLHSPGTGGMYS